MVNGKDESENDANKEKITCTAEPTEENAPNPLIVDRKTEKLRTETINELGPFDDESSRNDIGVASSHISVKKIEATPVSRRENEQGRSQLHRATDELKLCPYKSESWQQKTLGTMVEPGFPLLVTESTAPNDNADNTCNDGTGSAAADSVSTCGTGIEANTESDAPKEERELQRQSVSINESVDEEWIIVDVIYDQLQEDEHDRQEQEHENNDCYEADDEDQGRFMKAEDMHTTQ